MKGESDWEATRYLPGSVTWQGGAGISKTAGIHSLRHSVASHLLQSGLTLEEVSRFLGHSSLESTQIYTHLWVEMNQKED